MSKRTKYVLLTIAVLAAVLGLTAYEFAGPIRQWIHPSHGPQILLVSGNIEAHESVLSFKTVQSRIIELPFDEGPCVRAGSLITGVESAQQVTIAQRTLEVQERQHTVAGKCGSRREDCRER